MITKCMSKLRVVTFMLIGIFIIVAWLSVPTTHAGEKMVKHRVVSYLNKLDFSPPGDVKGHVIGFFSRSGLAFFEDGEVAQFSSRGTFDYINGEGPYQGYAKYIFKDGSTIVVKFLGTVKKGEKGKVAEGSGDYVNGTGRFEGIKGSGSYTCKNVTPYAPEKGTRGETYCDMMMTRTLPSK
jgi:hypothetical protein